MVRSLTQWTKTLSFPARLSPNKNGKSTSPNGTEIVNEHPVKLSVTDIVSVVCWSVIYFYTDFSA